MTAFQTKPKRILQLQDFREGLISVFIFGYIFFSLTWLSGESTTREAVMKPFERVWLFWGLDQNWRLFSPTIRDINFYPSAIITFEDGSKALWEPLLTERMNVFEKFQREKTRKWAIDLLPWEPFAKFQPDFARFVGRQYYNSVNKPVSISLNIHWAKIPPAIEPITSQSRLPFKSQFSTKFCYIFRDDDFKDVVIK